MADDPFGPRRIKLNSGHRKLLYLLSKYGRSAESNASTESWIREIQLQVLIFEGATDDLRPGRCPWQHPCGSVLYSARVTLAHRSMRLNDSAPLRRHRCACPGL